MVHKYQYHVPKIPLKASNEAFGRRPNKCLNEEAPNRARAQLCFLQPPVIQENNTKNTKMCMKYKKYK